MQRRGARNIRVLAAVAAVAMLASALPAGAVGAAKDDVACKVHNIGKSTNRDSLQRAVWAADPGDALLVQGTCAGTALIDKDLDISYMGWSGAPMPLGRQYVTSPRGRITSNGSRPALVIDPSVERFTVNPGLRVNGGIVIDDIESWRGEGVSLPAAWQDAAPSMIASTAGASLADCHVRNDETGAEFDQSQAAMVVASAEDQLSLRGSCAGETVIDEATRLAGWRIAISAMSFGDGPVSSDDSGPPTLARVSVDDDVDSLVLKQLRVTNGFSITDLAE